MNLIDRIAYAISGRSRAAKYRQFLDLVAPEIHETILDVGVNDEEYSAGDNYLEKHYPHPESITAVSQHSLNHFSERYSSVHAVVADGRTLPFADGQFSVVYSNAVIEHVGDRDAQLGFLRELVRAGRRGYLTTPNRHFPVELHTRVPLLHLFLSKSCFDRFLRFIGKEWATGEYMHLLSKSELESLLTEAAVPDFRIIHNRFLGLTLTFTVVWNTSSRHSL